MPTDWEKARGESMNYVEEIKQELKFYSYAGKADAASTHKEICRLLQARLAKANENVHLADDFLRGERSGELDSAIRSLKDDIEIFRDEVGSSYVDWKSPKANIVREIINKDVQIIRKSDALAKAAEEMREAALSKVTQVMTAKAAEANDLMKKLVYLFSDRERLCR